MSWWEITLASLFYGPGVAVCWRLVAGHLAYLFAESPYHSRTPDMGQWTGAICVGFVLGFVWPVVVIATRRWDRLAVGAEARHLQKRQAARIAQLEREADIR